MKFPWLEKQTNRNRIRLLETEGNQGLLQHGRTCLWNSFEMKIVDSCNFCFSEMINIVLMSHYDIMYVILFLVFGVKKKE